MSIGISSVIHLIGHIFMMQMDSFNLRFWSDSSTHLRSESFQRFIYFNKIQHFDPVSGDC